MPYRRPEGEGCLLMTVMLCMLCLTDNHSESIPLFIHRERDTWYRKESLKTRGFQVYIKSMRISVLKKHLKS